MPGTAQRISKVVVGTCIGHASPWPGNLAIALAASCRESDGGSVLAQRANPTHHKTQLARFLRAPPNLRDVTSRNRNRNLAPIDGGRWLSHRRRLSVPTTTWHAMALRLDMCTPASVSAHARVPCHFRSYPKAIGRTCRRRCRRRMCWPAGCAGSRRCSVSYVLFCERNDQKGAYL